MLAHRLFYYNVTITKSQIITGLFPKNNIKIADLLIFSHRYAMLKENGGA